MHVWISLAGAPVPVLSTADQVTGYTFTWPTQLPATDPTPARCSNGTDVACGNETLGIFIWSFKPKLPLHVLKSAVIRIRFILLTIPLLVRLPI